MDVSVKDRIERAGIAAPSADNSQPWLFQWDEDVLTLGIDPSRAGGVSDARYVLSDLAVGACVENMLVQARALGYDARLAWFPTDNEHWPVQLAWKTAEHTEQSLADVINQRHTDRRFPLRGPIAAATQARLAEQAERLNVGFRWLEGRPRRDAIKVLRQAEALRFKSPRLHAELFATLRFDVGWRGAVDEGLPPAALAVEAPVRPVFQALRRPGIMAALNRLGGATLLGFRSAALPARLSPGLCLLSIQNTARADIIRVGRALERVWLQATRERLAVQPFAAAGVLSLDFLTLEAELEPALGGLQRAMRALAPDGHGIMFLRLGHAPSPVRSRSGRRRPATFKPG